MFIGLSLKTVSTYIVSNARNDCSRLVMSSSIYTFVTLFKVTILAIVCVNLITIFSEVMEITFSLCGLLSRMYSILI